MDTPPPFAELPEEVCFTLDEVADLLYTIDVAVEKATRGTREHAVARRSQRLIDHRSPVARAGRLARGRRRRGRSSVEAMATTDVKLTVPEAARRLGMDGGDVYRLVFRGVLPAHPGSDGAIYIDQAAVDAYRADHSQGSQPRP